MTTTLMEIVVGCENYLGWQPRPGIPMWQARSAEIGKLKRAISTGNQQITIENLALALEYSRRKRIPISSPSGLLHRIGDALALAYTAPVPSEAALAIAEAIAWEQDRDDTDSLRWIHRLVRSAGPGQSAVLIEWEEAGRGI